MGHPQVSIFAIPSKVPHHHHLPHLVCLLNSVGATVLNPADDQAFAVNTEVITPVLLNTNVLPAKNLAPTPPSSPATKHLVDKVSMVRAVDDAMDTAAAPPLIPPMGICRMDLTLTTDMGGDMGVALEAGATVAAAAPLPSTFPARRHLT